ncbi:bifunctional adenosylcobinamide kinase/adenosylcobinamide-phosphate guanylyltransferase [Metabacillus sp. HB246100]
MQLVVGGAYSGKRALIREKESTFELFSAYNEQALKEWTSFLTSSTPVVVEGWEIWVYQQITQGKSLETIKSYFFNEIDKICAQEKVLEHSIYFIMLEMGRGIVPILEKDRHLRDLCGWILQYSTKKADNVYYCWHGLTQKLK